MTSYSVHLGDACDILPTLPDASFDCVISDPPYPEIDRPYGRMTEAAWHEMMRVVVRECKRVLRPTGSAVFILQPNSERVGRMRPWLFEFMAEQARGEDGWGLVQDVWWWNTAALPTVGSRQSIGLLRPSVKACAWIGPRNCYKNQDNVLWSESEANSAKRHEKRSKIGAYFRTIHPSGADVNHGKISESSFRRGGVTPFNLLPYANTSSAGSSGALGHGAGTPLALCRWWTRYLCPPGGAVLDPFAGAGTQGIAALEHGASFTGIEKMTEYVAIAEARLRDVKPAATSTKQPALPFGDDDAAR